jgi:hypothetical protein
MIVACNEVFICTMLCMSAKKALYKGGVVATGMHGVRTWGVRETGRHRLKGNCGEKYHY